MRRAIAIPILLVAATTFAQDVAVPSLDRLFPKEADVETDSGGLSRLELPAEILAQVKPDLSDVRLFDAAGVEVPYLVDSGLKRDEKIVFSSIGPAKTRNATRAKVPAGDRVPAETRETFEIAVPSSTPVEGKWTLVFRTLRSNFVRQVDVDGLDDSGRTTPWIRRASIFRLGSDRERLRIELPSGPGGWLRVSLVGQEGDYLEPEISFASYHEVGESVSAKVPLPIVATESTHGRTVIELARPQGLVPDEIAFESSTAAFDRPVEIWDEGPAAGQAALGARAIFRIQDIAVAEDRAVPVLPARGDRLRVVIADGDSPPLKELSVSAVVRRPALIFALAPANGKPSGVLRFGGGRAWRPAYDLAAFGGSFSASGAGSPETGVRARIASTVYDPAVLPAAKLGPSRLNARFDARPSLAFAMRAGGSVDPREWMQRRVLTLQPSADGLSRVRLTPADVAALRVDLGDLRVVDGQSRQWPYLLERQSRHEWIGSAVTATQRSRESHLALALPASPAIVDQVSLSIDSPFFDREFRLVAREVLERRDPRDEASRDVTLASGRLARRAGDPRPVTLAFAPRRLESLELIVQDRDDAPLPVSSARLGAPAAEIYVVAPAGSYSLLLGNPGELPPEYEVARVRDVVLAVESGGADAGALEPNPQFSRTARLAQSGARDTALLWGVLVVAVVGLGALTLKLARSPAKSDPKTDGGGGTV